VPPPKAFRIRSFEEGAMPDCNTAPKRSLIFIWPSLTPTSRHSLQARFQRQRGSQLCEEPHQDKGYGFFGRENKVGVLDDLPVGFENLGVVVRFAVKLLGDGRQGVSFFDNVVLDLGLNGGACSLSMLTSETPWTLPAMSTAFSMASALVACPDIETTPFLNSTCNPSIPGWTLRCAS